MAKVTEHCEIYKNLSLEDLPGEVWRHVIGFEGKYMVSNLGRMKNVERKVPSISGFRNVRERVKKLSLDRYGYVMTKLTRAYKSIRIHKEVCKTFIPNPENKKTVNHKNGIKTDNRVENLEWATYSENAIHAYENGLWNNIGEGHHLAKLDAVKVIKIRKKSSTYTVFEIAKMFNVSKPTIECVIKRKTWKQIK